MKGHLILQIFKPLCIYRCVFTGSGKPCVIFIRIRNDLIFEKHINSRLWQCTMFYIFLFYLYLRWCLEIIFWVLDIVRDTARQIRFSVSDNPLATVFSFYINKFTSVIALFLPLPLVAAFIKGTRPYIWRKARRHIKQIWQ